MDRPRVVSLLGFGAMLGLLLFASRATAPAFDELGRLALVQHALGIVQEVAARGLAALLSPHVQRDLTSSEGALGAFLGAWSRLSLGRVGLLDPLTSARLPWLVLSALAPLGLFALARSGAGGRAAGLAALLLALHPAWLHAAAVTAEAATLSSIWVVATAAYLRSLGPSEGSGGGAGPFGARLAWACGAAFALGLGIAFCRGAIWVAAGLFVHYSWTRRGLVRRALATGRWPVPVALGLMVVVVPGAVWLLTPPLWSANALGLVRWSLAPLSSSAWPGELSSARASLESVAWVYHSTPAITLLCLLAGLGLLVARSIALPSAPGSGSPREARALDLLIGIGLLFTFVLPPWLPRVLGAAAPRPEAALPFMALAAAIGVENLATRSVGRQRAAWAIASTGALAAISLWVSGIATAGASRWVQETPGDGSEVGTLAAVIDRLGAPRLSIAAPQIPAQYWQALQDCGRLKTEVTPGQEPGADLVIHRGTDTGGEVAATVRVRGETLWTLGRR